MSMQINQKNNTLSKNVKATIYLGIASFLTGGINYLTTPVFTRILSTSEYGEIALYNAVYGIMSVICTVSLTRPGVLTVGLYEYKNDRWGYLSRMLGAIAVVSLFSVFILFLFKDLICVTIGLPFSLIFLSLLCCAILPATTFWTYKQKYEYNYKLTFFVLVGSTLFSQLVSFFVVYYYRNAGYDLAVLRLWCANGINLLVAVFIYGYIVKEGRKYVDVSMWKRTILFTLPLIPHYLGFAFLNGTDRLMIAQMVGQDKVGIYSLSAVLSQVGIIFWQALCVSFIPFIHHNLGINNYSEIQRLTKPMVILISVTCLLISLVAPEIVYIMGSYKYAEGVYVVPAIMGGLFMHILYDIYSTVSFFRKKSLKIMVATIIAAVVNIVMNYFFIKRFGYIAAGYTTLFSYAVLAYLHYKISVEVERTAVFDPGFSIIISIITIILCLSCLNLYNLRIVRYMVLLIVIVLVFYKRKYFINSFNDMKV